MTHTTPPTEPTPMAEGGSRWAALIVLCVGMLMIVLDSTVVNVALPSIKDDLGFSASGLAWVVNAYLISFGGLLLLAGRLGDLLSRRDVFLSGLAVFTLASVLCGVASSQELLVAARFVQGVGGALASAVILGMIFTMFPEPREQAKAIGVFSFVASGGASVGLLVGGTLTQAINWHWIFFVNVPIGIGTAAFALRLLARDRGPGFGAGSDVPGAVLITGALMLLVYTIVVPAAELGWGAPRTLVLGAVALALIAAFVARQATARTPLVPLRIFRSRTVTGANLVQALLVAGMFALFFLGALYFQQVLGYDALQTGLAFLPSSLVMAGLSLRYTPVLITRFGPRPTLLLGMGALLAGLVWFTRAPVDGTYVTDVLPSMVLCGIGAGSAFPSLMTLSMADVAPEDAGLASGLVNTTMQVGGALGLAVLATLSAGRTSHLRDAGESALGALNGGYHLAYWVGAGLVVLAAVVAVVVLGEPRDRRGRAVTPEPAYSNA
jgi:EmrB/QacA subfamily drug resistance transporter